MNTFISYYKSPIGLLRLCADDIGLVALEFVSARAKSKVSTHKILSACIKQLDNYFKGKRKTFSLPLHPAGTPFQRQVWRALAAIPYGKTASYRDIAKQIKNPRALRAVGNANGKNPIPIIVPCHRVIASDGSLGGYSSGLRRKRWLLAHETN